MFGLVVIIGPAGSVVVIGPVGSVVVIGSAGSVVVVCSAGLVIIIGLGRPLSNNLKKVIYNPVKYKLCIIGKYILIKIIVNNLYKVGNYALVKVIVIINNLTLKLCIKLIMFFLY